MLMALGMNAGQQVMDGINRRAQDARSMGNQRELMDIQYNNQQGLNQQGHDLAMQRWEDTNYSAQMEQMRKAGLNPALMYGKGGQGGSTAGQGGGSAASGSAPGPQGTSSHSLAKDALTSSQVKLNEAQANKLDADTVKTSGVDTEESKGRIALNLSQKDLAVMKSHTEGSIQALNSSLNDLNEQRVRESEQNVNNSVAREELDKLEIAWNESTGLNRNDSIVAKTGAYLSRVTDLSEKTIIGIISAGSALKQLGSWLPAKALRDIMKGY